MGGKYSSAWYKLDTGLKKFSPVHPQPLPRYLTTLDNLNEDFISSVRTHWSTTFDPVSSSYSQGTVTSSGPATSNRCKCQSGSKSCVPLEENAKVTVFRVGSNKNQINCLSPQETEWVFGWNSDQVD